MKTYQEMDDGTWACDDFLYKYRLEVKGKLSNASCDLVLVYLSNIEEISYDEAYKAAGIGDNSDDYFEPKEAVLVEMRVE